MDDMHTRTQLMIGNDGVDKLREASVILCGCGAVGGYVLEGLVRGGVGRIRVVDSDVFSESNLNRQVLATMETVGRSKVEVACERARSINPSIDIECINSFVDASTIPMILDGDYDILVDAIDTIGPKCALLDAACARHIRTFSSMGAALHLDATAIRVAPLSKTKVCPLARNVRGRLKGCNTSNITSVYSEETPLSRPSEQDEHGKGILGSMPTIPAIFGMTLANEVIRYILGLRD
jgi:tRNA A37 threonylcarbamoyladenosine dehydratase